MKSKKGLGIALIGLGAVLLMAALVPVLGDLWQNFRIQREVERTNQLLQAAISETTPRENTLVFAPTAEPEETTEQPTDPTDPITLTSELLDGHEYVGYLEFPSLERKLPIIKIQYVEELQIAPCLERGSPHTNDAVISAHNYPAHFGPIRDWVGGEEVIFTDLQGNVVRYTASVVEAISPYDVEKVMESEHDLVLYTCTPGGAKRVMVGCDRTET